MTVKLRLITKLLYIILIVPEYKGQEALILPPVLIDEQQSRLPIKDYFVVLPQRQL